MQRRFIDRAALPPLDLPETAARRREHSQAGVPGALSRRQHAPRFASDGIGLALSGHATAPEDLDITERE
jgi:hypothetical protein